MGWGVVKSSYEKSGQITDSVLTVPLFQNMLRDRHEIMIPIGNVERSIGLEVQMAVRTSRCCSAFAIIGL